MTSTFTNPQARDFERLAWALRFEAGTAEGLSDAVEILVSDEAFLTGPMLAFVTVEDTGFNQSAWIDWEATAWAVTTGEVELSTEVEAAWLMAAHLAADVPIDIDDTLRAMDLHACSIAQEALGNRTEPGACETGSFWESAFAFGLAGRDQFADDWAMAGVIA
ncbi:hypothetical protein [Glycomyces salinus]|uniref:hypothetical protein n=1 Tax=Glycomyces salinus TaxID=980294 RepID=UPI0018ED48EB|nr:hypothetical protein [Glycomyces salinus]